MSANIKASTDGTQAIIGVGGVDQMTVSNAGVVTANSFVGLNSSSVTATGSTTARTLANRFADVVNVLDFGAFNDGTNAAATTTAIQNAVTFVATSGKQIFFPAGTYKISSVISTTGHLNILGEGEKTVLDFSGITSGSSGITVTGSITQIQNVTSASKGNSTIGFASAPSLITGDVFCLFDNSVLWNSVRSYYYAGEWLECRGTSGLNATTTNPLYDSYTPATVKAYKLSSPEVSFKNFRIIGGANIFGLIQVSFCDKPIFENISAYNENYQCIIIDRCYRAMVTNCVMYNKGTGTLDDYGLVIGNSQKVQVTGGDYYARRHGIAIGGGDYTCAVTNRNIRISNLTISNDILSQVSSADMHGNVEDVYYQGCQIYQCAAIAGKNTGYDNCTINNQYNGIVVYASELKGGTFSVRNCTLITNTDPSVISRSIIDFGGNGGAILSSTNETVSIIINNCHIEGTGQSSATDVLRMGNNGSSAYVNIYINGLTANVNAMGAILRTGVNVGSALSQAIVVDNISNFPSGVYLHLPIGGAYSNIPQRMMRQSGYLNMTASSGTKFTLASPISYKYIYPKTPQASFSIGGTTGFSNPAGENVGVTGYSVINSQIRPALTSTSNANWTQPLTVTANWIVGIEEV